jgi:hypothetical protein
VIVAGQGFKDFAVGEVLTSSDVDGFLMQQSVMRFADDGARGSALGTAVGTGVLAEGMVAYLDDVNQVQVYDGAAWKALGGLVAVKSAIFTGTQSATVAAGNNAAVTDLTITHACADAANKLVLTANMGRVWNQTADLDAKGRVGVAFHDGTGLIGVGTGVGSRTAVGAHVQTVATSGANLGGPVSLSLVHTPGDTTSRTYTVRVVNATSQSNSLLVNRTLSDGDNANTPRTAATFTLMEVRV